MSRARPVEIRHCSRCLTNLGTCCADDCATPPRWATLDADLVEHTHCDTHAAEQRARKPLRYHPLWAPAPEAS